MNARMIGGGTLLTLVLVASGAPAWAQVETSEALSRTSTNSLLTRGVMGYTWQGSADLDDGGAVSVNRFGIGGGVSNEVGDSTRLAAGLIYRRFNYDFSGGADFLGTSPWDNMNEVRLVLGANFEFNEEWSLFVVPEVDYAGEAGATLEKSLTGGGLLGIGWSPLPTFRTGVAVMVTTRQDEVTLPYPVVLLYWQIADNWVLRSGEFPLCQDGAAGLELDWAFTPGWELALVAQYQTWVFRLNSSGPVPDGIALETMIPVSVQLSYKAQEWLRASVFAGAVLGGSEELQYPNAHRVSKQDFDPAPMVGVRAVLQF